MADIFIPGVSSKYKTEELIKGLMEVKKAPVTTLENQVETYEKEKKVWQSFNSKLNSVRDSSKSLYGFDNPFNEKSVESSDESVIIATATKEAFQETRYIKVNKKASGDRFLTDSLDRDLKVDPGTYTFFVGEKNISFRYRGGSLSSFSRELNKKSSGLIRASVIQNQPGKQVLMIESQKTGKNNALIFKEDSLIFGEKTGLLVPDESGKTEIPLKQTLMKGWEGPLNTKSYSISDEELTLMPGASLSIRLPAKLDINDNMVFHYESRVTDRQLPDTNPKPPSGPDMPGPGTVTYNNITLENTATQVVLPDWIPPEKKEIIENMQIIYVEGSKNNVSLPDLDITSEFAGNQINLASFTEDLSFINLQNKNSHKEISLKNFYVVDTTDRQGYKPKNLVNQASDAQLEMDGVQIERPENTIDDLITGVTLDIQKADNNEIKLTINPDKESIRDSLIKFVYDYNHLISEIQIITSEDPSIIDELEYLSDDEREDSLEKLGMMKGDITLMQLKSRLQTLTMNPYPTREGNNVLLAEMGISSNESGFGGYDVRKMRGYLEINSEKLDGFIMNNTEKLKDLFGYDTDEDLIIDNGLAKKMDDYIKPYVQTGGFLNSRVKNYDSKISTTNRKIEDYKVKLDVYEQGLKTKYGNMEGILNELESSSNRLDAFNTNNK